jgi:amino acid transporter
MLNAESDIQSGHIETTSTEDLGLRRKVLSSPQVLGQSVAGIGPTIGAVSLIPLAFADAGDATWLTVVLATVGILAVGICITRVASVHFSAGALYNLVPQGLGKVIGLLTGWVTVLTMVFSGPFLITGFVQYLATFLSSTHIATLSAGTQYGLEITCIAGVLGMAVLDIRITTDAFLIIEGISMALICVLLVVILANSGNIIDHQQLSLHGSSVHGTLLALVFLMLAFGGFESATVLGLEAREPRKAMRLAVLGSVGAVGVFLVLNTYIQVLGLKDAHLDIASQSAPLSVLATHDGVKWLGDVILLGTMSSFFAAANSTLNYGPRVLFTMAHDGIVPKSLGKTLSRTGAPYRTILLYGFVWAAILSYI